MFDLSRPTPQTYAELQRAFDFFNERLFDNELPPCLLTLQREKRTEGYFSLKRFVHRDGQTYTDEIALNPTYFSVVPPMHVMRTIVHEMAHAWQAHFGTPGRRNYHNKEWAEKMESIGLMPSSTGEPGGAKTGEAMSDYTIAGGVFEGACNELLGQPDFSLSWFDRFPPEPPTEGKRGGDRRVAGSKPTLPPALAEAIVVPTEKENTTNRVKVRCAACGNQAWCKPKMKLICGEDECNYARMQVVE